MQFIPKILLKPLYTLGSLRTYQTDEHNRGIKFSLKNRLKDVVITRFSGIMIDKVPIPLDALFRCEANGQLVELSAITPATPLVFALRDILDLVCLMDKPLAGLHTLTLTLEIKHFGTLSFDIEDVLDGQLLKHSIPRDDNNDYTPEIITARHNFIQRMTDVVIKHIGVYSGEPAGMRGNIENFIGVAQVPLGLAGPLTVKGEHAQGEFLIPLATTEGTLVASYNRGIKILNESGGVQATVSDDAMQRAPVFIFDNAKAAREFSYWVKSYEGPIGKIAESTSSVAKLIAIETYTASKFTYLRFNFFTGDAAGQNMVTRATQAACEWILDNYRDYPVRHFFLESNMATDKKASFINTLCTRGKRVTAEAIIKKDVLLQYGRVSPQHIVYHTQVASLGGMMAGVNNNGLHAANALAALFIATGQDVANIAESSAGLFYTELTPEGDLYASITLPSLIIATHGGGTGLPTQQENLNLLGCAGQGQAKKLAEIIAGVVLAGEISLAAAISASDWVSSHEHYGRNR